MNQYLLDQTNEASNFYPPGKRELPRSCITRIAFALILACLLAATQRGQSFCGFYVSKADTKLFNKASQVVLVRSEDKTVMTMANDFQGDPKEFAVVIPVPTFLEKGQIHVGDKALIDRLDG